MFKQLKLISDFPEVNRFQANVADEFRNLSAQAGPAVLTVQSTASVRTYAVQAEDQYLVVNARGGPMSIVMPPPDRRRQVVHVKNAYTGNPVTIVQANGAKMGDGFASIAIPAGESATMVLDGEAWFRF